MHIQKLFNWKNIDLLGKMRFSKSSYYFIVIVPVLVKFTDALEKTLTLNIGDSKIALNLELPFSWMLFYFGAIFIAIGSIMYVLTCPKIIKRYSCYNDFIQAGESDSFIFKTAEKYDSDNSLYKYLKNSTPFAKNVDTSQHKNITRHTYSDKDDTYSLIYLETRKNLFNELYNKINYANYTLRLITFMLYMLGISLFLVVIIQNILYVFSFLLN